METNKIYQMDCIEGIRLLNKESIDCVITDPPYNISRKTNFSTMKGHRGTSMDYGEWDKGSDVTLFIKELPRVLKIGCNVVVFSSWEGLGNIAKVMRENSIEPKRCLVLNKSNPAPFNRDRLFVNDVEFAVWGVYRNKNWVFNREDKLEKCIINTKVQGKKLHPTMKDVKVIEKLIRILSKEGGVILDCFMGSGTTAIACRNTNRNFIGFETSKQYFDIANKRLIQKGGLNSSQP